MGAQSYLKSDRRITQLYGWLVAESLRIATEAGEKRNARTRRELLELALLHGLEVVAQPHATYTGRRHRQPALPEFIGDANLAEGRLVNGQRDDRFLDVVGDPVLEHRLAPRDLLQRQFPALS